MDNANSKEYLEKIRIQVLENLRHTAHAPSVQMTDVPRDSMFPGLDDETEKALDDQDEDDNKDTRSTKRRFDKYVEKDGELSESEDDEEEAAEIGVRLQGIGSKRRNQINYRNLDIESGVESSAATPREGTIAPEGEVEDDEKMGGVEDETSQGKPTSEPPTRPESRAGDDGATDIEPTGDDTTEKEQVVETPVAAIGDSPTADVDTAMEDAPPETVETENPVISEALKEVTLSEVVPKTEPAPPQTTSPDRPERSTKSPENTIGDDTVVAPPPAPAAPAAPAEEAVAAPPTDQSTTPKE